MHVRLFFKENTTGIIERKIYGDGGTVRYYVDINGQVVNVKSDFYSSKTKSLPTGKKQKWITWCHLKELNQWKLLVKI